MRTLRNIVVTLLLVAALAVVFWQRRERARWTMEIGRRGSVGTDLVTLENENRKLRLQLPTPAESEAWPAVHAELLRLRAAASRPAPAEKVKVVASVDRATETGSVFRPKVVATSDLKLKSEWVNAGIATPGATLETSCWADLSGDVDAMLSTLLINEPARIKAKEVFDRLPPDQQAKYGSPDRLIAMLSIGGHTQMAGIKVLDEIERSPGVVVLHTLWQYDDGRIRENTGFKVRQTADGWKVPITVRDVDEMINWRLRPEPPHDGPR